MDNQNKSFTAIAINDKVVPLKYRKYRRIHNRPASLRRFESFILKEMGTGTNVNYYGTETKNFINQVRL